MRLVVCHIASYVEVHQHLEDYVRRLFMGLYVISIFLKSLYLHLECICPTLSFLCQPGYSLVNDRHRRRSLKANRR